jgi:hypothetical protein
MVRWIIVGIILSLSLLFLPVSLHRAQVRSAPVFQKGFSYVASEHDQFGSAASDKALQLLQGTGTEWVSVLLTWYQTDEHSTIIYRDPRKTPDDEGLLETIAQIHKLGMKVMLRPLINPDNGSWRGDINFSSEDDWSAWFRSYRYFIDYYAELAQRAGVEEFCVGVELSETQGRASDWRDIITGVRSRFHGPLVYSANWSDYQQVSFWDALDYIGIDAYFDLAVEPKPTAADLRIAWKSWLDTLENFYLKMKKPILFTEVGLRSMSGAAIHPWDWKSTAPIDLQEQADYYRATLETFWEQPWFDGFYWWAWLPDSMQGGPTDDGYSPHGKPAEAVLKAWYTTKPH